MLQWRRTVNSKHTANRLQLVVLQHACFARHQMLLTALRQARLPCDDGWKVALQMTSLGAAAGGPGTMIAQYDLTSPMEH